MVKSLNESKISRRKHNKNESLISKDSYISQVEVPSIGASLFEEPNDRKCNIKDISGITQNSNFVIKSSIHNSMFNCNENLPSERLGDDKEEDFDASKKTIERDFNFNKNFDNVQNSHVDIEDEEGEFFFQKILNAQYNEEIILPKRKIKMKGLLITKPVRIIGQPNCVIEITEGPISINISENYENEVVKFSQIKIVFNICETEKSIIKNYKGESAKFTVLFRLYPGSLVEIEDCDISCIKDNSIPIARHKLICFQLMYCKYIGKNTTVVEVKDTNKNKNSSSILSSSHLISPTILTIISSRIEKFYQTIRSAENCIINIEKSFINKNIGKSLCILNPLIIKVHGSIFEGNGDNAIHLKFVKDDNLLFDNRKLFFKNNEFSYNFGAGVYIDGIENFLFDLDFTIESNTFKKNKGDAVFMLDLYAKSLVIKENKFLFGKSNGLNLNKVYQKNNTNNNITTSNCLTSASYVQDLPLIEIRENEFIENEGFGIFMNDSKAQILMNNFFQNRGCGILLINLNLNQNTSTLENNPNNANNNVVVGNKIQQSSNNNVINNSMEGSTIGSSQGNCFISKNSFVKNGGSGVRIINYNYFTFITECYFKENVEFGVQIENDYSALLINNIQNNNNPTINNLANNISSEKIKTFKNHDNSKMPKETNLFLHNCSIVNNMKSGIFLNNCFIFIENTIISDNLDYAIYTPKEEFRYCYKQSKQNEKNLINGNVGGPWGEVSISTKTLCNGCSSSSSKIKKKNIITAPDNNVAYASSSNHSSNSNSTPVQNPSNVPNNNDNINNNVNANAKSNPSEIVKKADSNNYNNPKNQNKSEKDKDKDNNINNNHDKCIIF